MYVVGVKCVHKHARTDLDPRRHDIQEYPYSEGSRESNDGMTGVPGPVHDYHSPEWKVEFSPASRSRASESIDKFLVDLSPVGTGYSWQKRPSSQQEYAVGANLMSAEEGSLGRPWEPTEGLYVVCGLNLGIG